MVSRLLIVAVIVWLFGYPMLLDNVDLAGTIFAKPLFHVGVTAVLIATVVGRELWRRMTRQDTSKPVGVNVLILIILAVIAGAIFYTVATGGFDVLVAKAGSPWKAAAVLAGFVIALGFLWMRIAHEPVCRFLSRSGDRTE